MDNDQESKSLQEATKEESNVMRSEGCMEDTSENIIVKEGK